MSAGPYRRGKSTQPDAPDDEGIVADLIKQFASPLAFYRELVQNAIDAETDEVVVTVHEVAGEPLVVSVSDRGEGMTQQILQERLLVLFRSGKEGRNDKIGKFGIGFVSVLAMNPQRVTVTTSRGDGATYVMHLNRDHTYELYESGGGERAGTTVALTVPVKDVTQFAKESVQTLKLWCRFAQTPIRFRHLRGGGVVREERIDRPLGLRDMMVDAALEQGECHVVLGVSADHSTYGGFFNQGLLLYETGSPLAPELEGLHFIVQDRRLEHTLSRDDVRRDAAFDRALRQVVDGVEKQLMPRLVAHVEELARAGHEDHPAAFRRALSLAQRLRVNVGDLWVPRLAEAEMEREAEPEAEPDRGVTQRAKAVRLGDIDRRFVIARVANALTQALETDGWAVLHESLEEDLRTAGLRVSRASEMFTLFEKVVADASDEALLDIARRRLDDVGREPRAIALVRVWGGPRRVSRS